MFLISWLKTKIMKKYVLIKKVYLIHRMKQIFYNILLTADSQELWQIKLVL